MSWLSDTFNSISSGISDSLLKPLEIGYDIINSERNYNLQNSNYHYQKMLQQQLFEREDNAVQRRVADLKAAGFNPLLAAGGNGAGAGSVVSVSAPQRSALKSINPESIIALQLGRANVAKTIAETEVAKETRKNISEQNANIRAQNKILGLNAEKLDHDLDIVRDTPGIPSDTPWYGRAILRPFSAIKSSADEWYTNYRLLRNRGHSRLKSAGLY